MSNHELDHLRAAEQEAFRRKQALFQVYIDAKNRASEAHDAMDAAWRERSIARDEMNREYEAMQASYERNSRIWEAYRNLRDYNNSQIDSLRHEADYEHREMIRCFDQASSEYEYGDKSAAPAYASEGHEHKDRRDELNSEISTLIQEIKDAKRSAEWQAPRTDNSAFKSAKERFERAKIIHESAQTEFKRLKAERDRAKADFDSAQAEHVRLKAEFQTKLEEVKARNQRERDSVLDKAGVNWLERNDAKVVKKSDGTTQIYHGGLGSGDGIGHGHTVLDGSGRKTYDRGAFSEHGSQNFTDDGGKGVTFYDRRARKDHDVAGIAGGINLRGDYYHGKKAGVIGHSTQYYDDGVRLSRDTRDGVHEENIHWTDERLPDGHPDRHHKPKD